MIQIARLAYHDLVFIWDRESMAYTARGPEKFDRIFTEITGGLAKDRKSFIGQNCLFPWSEDYVAALEASHAGAGLKIEIIYHLSCPEHLASGRRAVELPFNDETLQEIRAALAAARLPNGFPLLAEIMISLSR